MYKRQVKDRATAEAAENLMINSNRYDVPHREDSAAHLVATRLEVEACRDLDRPRETIGAVVIEVARSSHRVETVVIAIIEHIEHVCANPQASVVIDQTDVEILRQRKVELSETPQIAICIVFDCHDIAGVRITSYGDESLLIRW